MTLTPEELALLRLSLTTGIGPVTGRGLIELFGSARALYETSAREMRASYDLSEALIHTLLSSDKPLREAEVQVKKVEKDEEEGKPVGLIFMGDANYPEALDNCPDAPLVLFVKGKLPTDGPSIGVVGTRRNTPYAYDALHYLISNWAEERPDLVITSGLAYGIDAIGHTLAIETGLRTVAVVAHGLDSLYPASHRSLAERIIEHGGGIVTEFPYGTRALPQRFIARNRIVAGLSLGLLVGESASRGGALATATFALDYGRSVYAVPGRLFDPMSEGCNRLILSNKAAIAINPHDILEDLGLTRPIPKVQELPFSDNDAEDDDTREEGEDDHGSDPILRILLETDEITVGELALRLGESVSQLSGRLFSLEMEGKIRARPGGKYAPVRSLSRK